MRISGALSICAFLSTVTIQVFAAVLTPPPAPAVLPASAPAALPVSAPPSFVPAQPHYDPLPVYIQVTEAPGSEPSYAQLYKLAKPQVPASTGGQLPASTGGQLPASAGGQLPASAGGQLSGPAGGQLSGPAGSPLTVPYGAQLPATANTQLPVPVNATSAVAPISPAGAPVSSVPTPASGLECKCPPGKAPVMFAGLCICGECAKVSDGVKSYNTSCPDSKFAAFNQGVEKNCKEIENTEDCEFFKKSPGALTDDYKRCRDQLDSIMDDCENDATCCSTMVKPGEPAPADD